MVYEPSFLTLGSPTMMNYAKKLTKKPNVEIRLDADSSTTFTTGSVITGCAIISSSFNASFDEIQITLEGQTKVALQQMSQISGHSTIEASHTFLKLNMPIPESSYPVPRTLESGDSLRLPFNFVVPGQLLPHACTHKCHDHVHEAHMCPPPSMGGEISPNDFTPNMSRVHYFIAVKILRKSITSEKSLILSTATEKIRVLPTTSEDAPLHIDDKDTEYQLCRTKTLKKGVFKGKLGELTARVAQPPAFNVHPTKSCQAQTTATLHLIFAPVGPASRPPKLNTVTAKIKSTTFASITASKDLAKSIDHLTMFDPLKGIYTTSTTLSNMTIDSSASWKWIEDAPSYAARRDSGYETCGSDMAERLVSVEGGHYEAFVKVPMTLPECKTWLPTFHSCLVSRIYSLDLSISVNGGSGAGMGSTFHLRAPVQIASVGDADSAINTDAIEEEVEDALRPRVLSVPDARFQMGSSLPGVSQADLLPGYEGGYESYIRRESASAASALSERVFGFDP